MKKINITKMINYLIVNNRQDALNALVLSDVNIGKETTDKNLLNTTMDQLNSGNEKLMINLGSVLDQNFDLSQLENKEYSNFNFGEFWGKNQTAIISGGFGLLKGLFGGKGNQSGLPQPTGGNNDLAQIMLMQQQAQQQEARKEEARRREEAAKRNNTMLIFGSIAGLLIVGGIVTFALTRNRGKVTNKQ